MNRARLFKKTAIEQMNDVTNRTKINGSMNYSLVPNEALVFYGRISEFDETNWLPTLSKQEIVRAEQHLLTADKSRYIISKAILKRLLSYFSNVNESEIAFKAGKHGKPFLQNNSNVQFNCSHSEEIVVIALVRDMEIGVDIESSRRAVNHAKLQSFLCTPAELIAFNELEETTKQEAFIELWTRKEALLKALGDGLTRPMNTLILPHSKDENTPREMENECTETKTNWFVESYTLLEQYHGAVAVQGRIDRVQYIPLNESELLANKRS